LGAAGDANPNALLVPIDLLAFLVALLRFHRQRRDGPGFQPLQRDRLAGLLAIAVGIVLDSLQRGVAYLLKTQLRDGSWQEAWYTGTGFPRVFYLMYYMYRQYFPLIALTAYAKASVVSQEEQLRIARIDRRNR